MKTKEEILNSHPFLKVWYENPDDSPIPCCNEEQALWAMEEYANQFKPTCETCRFNKAETYHNKMWYRDCQQMNKYAYKSKPTELQKCDYCHKIIQNEDYCDCSINKPLPSDEEIREAVFKYDGLKEKTMLRWPIPEDAPKNQAFYDGVIWMRDNYLNLTK